MTEVGCHQRDLGPDQHHFPPIRTVSYGFEHYVIERDKMEQPSHQKLCQEKIKLESFIFTELI